MAKKYLGKEERIQRVLELIALGYMTFQVVDICTKEWKVCRRTIERYLTIVYEFLRKQAKIDKDQALAEYESLINREELAGNKDLARKYRLQRDKILQIAVDKVDHKHSGDINFNWGDEG
jgi:hypothetical protein